MLCLYVDFNFCVGSLLLWHAQVEGLINLIIYTHPLLSPFFYFFHPQGDANRQGLIKTREPNFVQMTVVITCILPVAWHLLIAGAAATTSGKWEQGPGILNSGVITVNLGDTIDLPCQNKTPQPNTFSELSWLTDAYSHNTKLPAYSWSYTWSPMEIYDGNKTLGRVIRNDTSIKLLHARLEDSGEWDCELIFLYFGEMNARTLARYQVKVVGPPAVAILFPPLISAPAGSNDQFVYCEAQGPDHFEIRWYRTDGKRIKQLIRQEEVTHNPANKYLSQRVYIHFTNMSEDDVGYYICKANNSAGAVSQRARVRLQVAPRIVSPNKFQVNQFETGELLCRAEGYPEVSFVWRYYTKSGKRKTLKQGEKSGRFEVGLATYDEDLEYGTSLLTVRGLRQNDWGDVSCVADNAAGSAESNITLFGFGIPDPPKIIKVTKTLDTAVISWQLGDSKGSPITRITIEMKNVSSSEWFSIRFSHTALTSFTYSNLVPHQAYDFRMKATNEIGDSEWSRVYSASTHDPVTAGPSFSNMGTPAIIGTLLGAFFVLILAMICLFVYIRRWRKKIVRADGVSLGSVESEENATGERPLPLRQTSVRSALDDRHGLAFEMELLDRDGPVNRIPDSWEFSRDRLRISTVLGAGAFGIVMRGTADGIKGTSGSVRVAVKTVRDSSNETARRDFMAELNLLKLIPEHPNVLGLLGCCTRLEPPYAIVEYCSYGDLQGFLRNSRGIYERYYRTSYGSAIPDLTSRMLLTFAMQICKGMAHLAAVKVIHRDLAARNILVDDQLICKVSDFGFARDIQTEDHYLKRSQGGRFPIKWMAIESLLDNIFTTKSDVWAMGVVLWELVTLGASPYPGRNSYEVVSFLQDGYRMDKPKHCADEVYDIMMECWNVSPGRRPSFLELVAKLQTLVELNTIRELINMNFYQDHLYVNFDGTNRSTSIAESMSASANTNSCRTLVSSSQYDIPGSASPVPGSSSDGGAPAISAAATLPRIVSSGGLARNRNGELSSSVGSLGSLPTSIRTSSNASEALLRGDSVSCSIRTASTSVSETARLLSP